MSPLHRPRLIFHGAVLLLVGLFCGIPTTVETIDGAARAWHTAHEALIMMGIWILAESSVLPALVLGEREGSVLVWSLIAMGYSFAIALVIGGAVGTTVFSPGSTPLTFAAFIGATFGILCAFLAASLTLMGAQAAFQAARHKQ